MKKLFVLAAFIGFFLIYSCGNSQQSKEPAASGENASAEQSSSAENGNPSYDPERGAGKFTNVDVPANLNTAMAAAGEKVYDVKCSGCHKLSNEKLVGPGWKEVTKRHKPEWIMNFITNTDEMITKDPKAQAQLEICMVRMPNQNLTDEDARSVFEFMRKNDGVK
jgi:mono/diheme cytochrome c family protein